MGKVYVKKTLVYLQKILTCPKIQPSMYNLNHTQSVSTKYPHVIYQVGYFHKYHANFASLCKTKLYCEINKGTCRTFTSNTSNQCTQLRYMEWQNACRSLWTPPRQWEALFKHSGKSLCWGRSLNLHGLSIEDNSFSEKEQSRRLLFHGWTYSTP